MGKNCNVTWLLFDSGVSLEQNGQIFHSLGERVGGGGEGLFGGETPLALRPLSPHIHTEPEKDRRCMLQNLAGSILGIISKWHFNRQAVTLCFLLLLLFCLYSEDKKIVMRNRVKIDIKVRLKPGLWVCVHQTWFLKQITKGYPIMHWWKKSTQRV